MQAAAEIGFDRVELGIGADYREPLPTDDPRATAAHNLQYLKAPV